MKALVETLLGLNCRCVLLALVMTVSAAAGEQTGERAAKLLQPFKRDLQAALQNGMAQGVLAAIDSCHVVAPQLAATSPSSAIKLGRTSHRLRNPANVSPPWVEPVLNDYLASGDRAPQTVPLAGGKTGYVEPIVIKPLCLNCHGDSLVDPVRAKLDSLYPQDRATGFRLGELRGVFWLEFE